MNTFEPKNSKELIEIEFNYNMKNYHWFYYYNTNNSYNMLPSNKQPLNLKEQT